MRPVNLLPSKHRPRTPSGALHGSSYALIGVLATLLLAVVLYLVTANQVTSRHDDTARAKSETAVAKARSGALANYGAFAKVKETRLASVKALAQIRFDWERLSREVALVLPAGVTATEVQASLAGEPAVGSVSAGGSASAASSSSASAAGTGAAGPTLNLSGCARSHREVATTLVRLRRLHRARDVTLAESADAKASTSGGGTSTTGSAVQTCGAKQTYNFKASVVFDPLPPSEDSAGREVPARLGGGS